MSPTAPDHEILVHRLTATAVRVASLEDEVALLVNDLDVWWSGPAAARFQEGLRRQRAVLAIVRRDLSAAAVRSR